MPSADLLLDAYRIMRRLDGPPDSPYPGLLAHSAATGTCVLVDVEILGDDWTGWLVPHDGHILGPADLVRRSDGHAVALPVCTERLDDFLGRRLDAPLTDGERLTLAVSVLRACADAATIDQGAGCPGTWWLTEGGRPVFAPSPDGEPIASAADALLDELAHGARPALVSALAEARETAAEPTRLGRGLTRLEELLFATAVPEPLATTVFAPRRVRSEPTIPQSARAPDDAPRERSLVARLAGNVDADLADAFSQASTAVWRRFRRADREPATSRRRPLLVAAAVAAVVLAGGLLWPTGGAGPATAQPDATAAAPTGAPSAEATATPSDVSGQESLEAVLDALLTARSACGADSGCLAPLQDDASAVFPPGAIDEPATERTITLLDEFGGAAVLRVESSTGGIAAQLVVIFRRDEKWVLRDVHDVAEHPG
ncbi:hypothetical protein ACH3VR_06020 [Microbacterium sp. B2969]|uniref:DUF4878 domain-containing protein n=1 Tax=Microbacterium alkaliflavum TaxID=3248839 RepID=A0ABW7Q4Z3_9MICO